MDGNGFAGKEIVNEVAEQVAGLNSKLEEQVDSAIAKARKAGSSINAYVKENPWQAAGLAVAAGFLAGWLMKKRD